MHCPMDATGTHTAYNESSLISQFCHVCQHNSFQNAMSAPASYGRPLVTLSHAQKKSMMRARMVQCGCRATVFHWKAQLLNASNLISNGNAQMFTDSPNKTAMLMHFEKFLVAACLERTRSYSRVAQVFHLAHINLSIKTPYFEK